MKTPKDIILYLIVGIIILQISSIAISKITGVEVVKLGWAVLLIILASFLAVLSIASFRFGSLKKEDFYLMFVIIGGLVATYISLPKYFPEIFSGFKSGIFSVITP